MANTKPLVTKPRFWRAMMTMRLTTQQKSGPKGYVAQFIRQNPFPLAYEEVQRAHQPEALMSQVLRKAGGIRFGNKIAQRLSENLRRLEKGEWESALAQCNRLTEPVSREVEIEVADYVREHFLGFGPKQSRNLLQSLGLTRYEIPIDSRLTKWLNGFGFPVRLNAAALAAALADGDYYRFVSE